MVKQKKVTKLFPEISLSNKSYDWKLHKKFGELEMETQHSYLIISENEIHYLKCKHKRRYKSEENFFVSHTKNCAI